MQNEPPAPLQADKPDFSYDCFISYRRSDGGGIAQWLRRRLLGYRLPPALRDGRNRPLSIYLDTTYERATDDYYNDNIAPALKESRFLLVVATPSANLQIGDGQPNWVEREIADFLDTPQRNNILAVRAAGRWDDPFPGKLLKLFPYLNIVDAREVSISRLRRLFDWIITPPEITTLAAPLFGITQKQMPELRREETKRARARLASAAVVTAGVLISIASLGAYAWHEKLKTDAANQTIFARYLAAQSAIVAADAPRRLQEGLLLATEAYRRDASSITSAMLHDRVDPTPVPIARFRHDAPVNVVKFTPDGKNLISGGNDGYVRVWDVETRRQLAQLHQDRPALLFQFGPGPDEVTTIFRTPLPRMPLRNPNPNADDAGRLVSWRWKDNTVTGTYDAPKTVYDVLFDSSQPIGVVKGGIWRTSEAGATIFPGYASEWILRALSHDSRFLALGRDDAENVDVFDSVTGRHLQSIPVKPGAMITSIYFNRDGKRLLIGQNGGTTSVVEWESNTRLYIHPGSLNPAVFAFSPDGKYVAEIDSIFDSTLRIWESGDGHDVFVSDKTKEMSGEIAIHAAFSEDSRLLVVCPSNRAVQVIHFDGKDFSKILHFTTQSLIVDIALHPNGKLLATADNDGWVTLWRLDRGWAAAEFPNAETFETSRDGRLALLGGEELRIIDPQLNVTTLPLDTTNARFARFSASGKMLAISSKGSEIALVDFAANNKILPWFDPGGAAATRTAPNGDGDEAAQQRAVKDIGFSSDDKKLILVRRNGISEADLTDLIERPRLPGSMSSYLTISSDGSLLAVKKTGGPIEVYSLRSFEKIWPSIPSESSDTSIAFSPNGRFFAGRAKKTSGRDDEARPSEASREDVVVWNTETKRQIFTIPVTSSTSKISFDSTSNYLAVSDKEDIQIWSTRSHEKQFDLAPRINEISSISFHPTEPYLAVSYRDKKIRIWKLLPEPQIVTEIPQDQGFAFGEDPVRFTLDGRFVFRIDGNTDGPSGWRMSFIPWRPEDVLRNACARTFEKGLAPEIWENYLKGQPYRETCALP